MKAGACRSRVPAWNPESSAVYLAAEFLALTKTNWNQI
jgi:hypothetical protein